jgi:hypothetical protein
VFWSVNVLDIITSYTALSTVLICERSMLVLIMEYPSRERLSRWQQQNHSWLSPAISTERVGEHWNMMGETVGCFFRECKQNGMDATGMDEEGCREGRLHWIDREKGFSPR